MSAASEKFGSEAMSVSILDSSAAEVGIAPGATLAPFFLAMALLKMVIIMMKTINAAAAAAAAPIGGGAPVGAAAPVAASAVIRAAGVAAEIRRSVDHECRGYKYKSYKHNESFFVEESFHTILPRVLI